MASKKEPQKTSTASSSQVALRHLRFGWWSLLFFLTLGIVLEVMHGFKVRWYLDVANETRRLMWTLAHAHGTLLSMVNLGLACSLRSFDWNPKGLDMASPALVAATVLLPGGFFLGGVIIYGGDPGLGIFLVPLGALALLLAVVLLARSASSAK